MIERTRPGLTSDSIITHSLRGRYTDLSRRKILRSLKKSLKSILGHSQSPEILKPISYKNFVYWLRRTIKTDQYHYHPTTRALTVQRVLATLDPNLRKPIFIVGSPRSGTTFLGNCIGLLPEISYHFEPVATKAATRYVYSNQWSQKQATQFFRTTYAWLMRIHMDADLRFAEKTPQISFILPFLAQVFPDAKFVHIIRDGRDVALSLAEKPWHRSEEKNSMIRDPDGYLCGPWARFWVETDRAEEFEHTNNLHRCVWIWRRHIEEILKASATFPPEQYHVLKYEDLIRAPIPEAQKLLSFLEISDRESCNFFETAVANDVRSDSIGRWQTSLSESQLLQIKTEAGNLMNQLGYTI